MGLIPMDNSKLTHAAVLAHNLDGLVQIDIQSISMDAIGVYVLATDLTTKCPTRPSAGHCRRVESSNVSGEDTSFKMVGEAGNAVSFADRMVTDGHTYRYDCVLIYPTGKEEHVPLPLIHTYRSGQELGRDLIITLTLPKSSIDEDGNTEVTLEVGGEFTSTGLNTIVESLQAVGISGDFQKEVEDNKEQFQQLLRCVIERQNLKSGLTETFGVQPLGIFKDSLSTRAVAGVEELRFGNAYKYVVRLVARDPLGVLQGGKFQAIDTISGQKFIKRVGKFLNPLVMETGTLPSTARIDNPALPSKLQSTNVFLQGETGVSMQSNVAFIAEAQANEIVNPSLMVTNGINSLTWEISSDPLKFDHFLIHITYMGISSVIGSVHNDSANGLYSYKDYQYSFAPGDISYQIQPVYRNLSYGIKSLKLTTTMMVPSYITDYWSQSPPPSSTAVSYNEGGDPFAPRHGGSGQDSPSVNLRSPYIRGGIQLPAVDS
jgi:hypothetical protein